ncbi:MAG: AMP-binding protein [Actinophytocola sp.]|uniref:class I adenylate-forming enzyme family protein n=1 Tax=Actinophytocola sp. TaxID=1872138 RepID=UPI00132B9E95|nr:AMP-binding protein [Actinophytocola sp.]MPZ83520.1 AMP-binding protein [Actinophytocola sp.]
MRTADIISPFEQSDLVRDGDGLLWFGDLPRTYPAVLEEIVRARPSTVAVVDSDDTAVTYEQLWDRALRVAGGLRDAGVAPGDRVAIDLGNSLPWVETFLGTLLAGGVAVPVDQRANRRAQQAVLADADPRLVVDPGTPAPIGTPFRAGATAADLAQMLYTSGTTGEPKGVMISQRNLAALGEITRRVMAVDMASEHRIRNVVAIPLCHAAGCNAQLLPTLALGGTVLLTRSTSAGHIIDVARRHRADTILAVPAVYQLLTQREPAALSALTSLQRVYYGAAPIAESLISRLRTLLPHARLGNAYGMTEINNIALFLPDEMAQSHHDSVGFPVPGVEVAIGDPDANGHGELFLRGPNMALGYWRKPELTAETFRTGWVRSGDIATVDTQGLVYIRDRIKDVINRGGEKIFTVEVENTLLSHPDIDEAAVIPVADEVMGEKVGAIVVLRPDRDLTESAVLAHVTHLLPRYCVPERLVLRTKPLPRGGSGKILKAQLRRELGWHG